MSCDMPSSAPLHNTHANYAHYTRDIGDICWHPGGLALTARALHMAQRLMPLRVGAKLLDVGCGHGKSTAFLREQGFHAYGLDYNTHSQAHVLATATRLPFATASFQGILCECVLSIIEDKTMALQEFYRVTCAPAISGTPSTSGTLLMLSDMYCSMPQAQENTLSKAQLEDLLQECGWKVQYFEDHSHTLKAFAAQLAWHNACHTLPQQRQQEQQGQQEQKGRYGYGLWIATKEKV